MKQLLKGVKWTGLLACIVMTSCTEEISDYEGDSLNFMSLGVLKERNSNYPWESAQEDVQNVRRKSVSSMTFENYLGCSLKTECCPIEDTTNIGNVVFDAGRLSDDYPSLFRKWGIHVSESRIFTYTSFYDYMSKANVSRIVENGANLDLGVFSINNKSTFKNVFSEDYTSQKNLVLGEMNLIYKDS